MRRNFVEEVKTMVQTGDINNKDLHNAYVLLGEMAIEIEELRDFIDELRHGINKADKQMNTLSKLMGA